MEDIIDIIVTETTNLIEITSQPTDEVIDVNIIDNREDITLNVTPSVVEININSLTGNFGVEWGDITGTLSNQTDLNTALSLKADLVDGKVPSSQLPSYVDDVVEVANYASLPATGEVGKIYITLDTNFIYRWTGSTYVEIKDSSAVWGAITGTLSSQTDLQSALNAKDAVLTFSSPLSRSTNTISISAATSSANGYLTSTDWSTFNAKQSALTFSSPLVNTSGTISMPVATSSANGYLSSTDWTTFNSKQAALSGTGFVKISGTTISYDNSTYLTTSDAANTYLSRAGGEMTGQIILKVASSSTDYTKGLKFPDNPGTGTGDISGLRLYVDSAENQVLELYVGNDTGALGSVDKINFATGVGGTANNDCVTINGNIIWNAGNLTPQSQLNGTGFVKASGTTISYDNSTYLTTSSAASTYLPLTGGTLTGTLNGTNITITNSLIAKGGTFNGGASYGGIVTIDGLGSDLLMNRANTSNGSSITLLTNAVEKWNIGLRSAGTTDNFFIYNSNLTANSLTINSSNSAATFASSVTATAHIVSGGTSSQFQKGDGSLDSNTYLTTSSASSTYLAKTGGTLTGALSGTSASFSNGLSINATQETWFSGYKIFQNNNTTLASYLNATMWLGFNYYTNSSGDDKYRNNGFATAYNQVNGQHIFYSAPSGTAGNTISFSPVLTLASSGAATFSSSVTADRILTAINVNNSTIVAGGIELQAYSINNSWIGENVYFDGTGFKARNTGYTSQIYFESNGGMAFKTSPSSVTAGSSSTASTKLYITSSGNVGIGTTSPISGGSAARWLTIDGTLYGGGVISSVNGTAQSYTYYDNTTTLHTIQAVSGVGIGFQTSNTERMRITSGGNVLVGTTTETSGYKLQVNGSIRLTGGGFIGGGNTVTVSALNTDYLLVATALNGVIVIRDNTTGGSGCYLIDPNAGVITIASNLNGIISFGYSSGSWYIRKTLGTVSTNYTWAFIGA